MQRHNIRRQHTINIDGMTLENVLKQVDQIIAKEPGPHMDAYFEQEEEWDYGCKIYRTYYVIVRPETDQEMNDRIAAEKERNKTQEDRELEQLRYLQEKYKDK